MKKRILALICAVSMVAMVGCGKKADEPKLIDESRQEFNELTDQEAKEINDWYNNEATDEEKALAEAYLEIQDALSDIDLGSEEEGFEFAPDELTYINKGDELTLATIKVTVLDCVETKELTAEWHDPVTATEGTKFATISYKVENITKTPIEGFDMLDGWALYDSQGRSLVADFDLTNEYTDDALWHTLSPNIPKEIKVVYMLPADAEGYGLVMANANTGEQYCLLAQ